MMRRAARFLSKYVGRVGERSAVKDPHSLKSCVNFADTHPTCITPSLTSAFTSKYSAFTQFSLNNISTHRTLSTSTASHDHSSSTGGTDVPSPTIIQVTDAQTFNAAVSLSNTIPVLLDAYAQWCAPCKQLDPVLKQQISARCGKIALAKMDIDTPQLAALVEQLRITSVPTLIMLYGGRAVDIKQGAPPPAELSKWLDKAIELAESVARAAGSPSNNEQKDTIDNTKKKKTPEELIREGFELARSPTATQHVETIAPLFAQALNSPLSDASLKAEATAGLALCAVLDGDFPTARELLANATSALENSGQDGPHSFSSSSGDAIAAVQATLELAEEASSQGDEIKGARIDQLQAVVDGNKTDLDALYALSLRHYMSSNVEGAADAALLLVRRNREWKEQAGKKLVIRIADSLGVESELGKSIRRRLSNIWFIE